MMWGGSENLNEESKLDDQGVDRRKYKTNLRKQSESVRIVFIWSG
jgi:hypothetical protein